MTTGSRLDPIRAFRFQIELDDLVVAGFSECTGIQAEIEVHEFQEGGLNTHMHKLPTRAKLSNITLKRGLVGAQLFDWFFETLEGRITRRNGSILVYGEPGDPEVAMSWEFHDAFPVSWVGPDLNALQSNAAMESLVLAHHGLIRRP